jgi:probable HAF family extracellular repeat protein
MCKSQPIGKLALVAMTGACVCTAAANPPQFSFKELCAPPGMHSPKPLGMNDHGMIVGEAMDDGQNAYMAAVAWIDDEPTRLTGIALSGAQALAASNNGTVVGTTDESFVVTAFTWNNGEIMLLTGTHGIAYAISNSGTVVGSVHDSGSRAARWVDGKLEHLLPAGTVSVARDINTHGEIVGLMSSDNWRAFHWKDAQWNKLPTLPSGIQAWANAINDSSVIAGWATTSANSFPHAAVLWDDGEIVQLNALGATSSAAFDINNAGVVVGRASSQSNVRAVLWHDGQIHDLYDLVDLPVGWNLIEALAIDNTGRIVGRGSEQGEQRAFLLTPLLLGDLNGDGHVDVSDLLLLLAAWGTCPAGSSPAPPCPADFNGDGVVDVSDLLILLANWG